MRFSKLYEELKFDDVFKKASPEEAEDRQKKYPEMCLKEELDNAKKTKLPDGTWHVHENLVIGGLALSNLKTLNVSNIDGYFGCTLNKLTSLEGGPKDVRGSFTCSYNRLTDLKGAPVKVRDTFICSYNKLTSLEGAPKEVDGDFLCFDNKKKFTKEDVRAVCDVKGSIYV